MSTLLLVDVDVRACLQFAGYTEPTPEIVRALRLTIRNQLRAQGADLRWTAEDGPTLLEIAEKIFTKGPIDNLHFSPSDWWAMKAPDPTLAVKSEPATKLPEGWTFTPLEKAEIKAEGSWRDKPALL